MNATPRSDAFWRIPAPIDESAFYKIRRQMMLEHCKWDSQVGDITTLAPFPLILRADVWEQLSAHAEGLSREIAAAEEALLRSPELLDELGLPREVRRIFNGGAGSLDSASARVMRFDFHWTTEGWLISEVNSDVPGGYCEASSFTQAVAKHFPDARPAGDPAARWAGALAASCARHPVVALLSAPGYMEDQQITAYLAGLLRERGCAAHLAGPQQLRWDGAKAYVRTGDKMIAPGLILRFYQGEWLANLPRGSQWQLLLSGAETPVSNPGIALLGESKRLPALLECLPANLPLCKKLFPESRRLQEVDWRNDERWIIKEAYSNNGDTVGNRALLPAEAWQKITALAARRPHEWVAQKRFEPLACASGNGAVFPCIGVYTVDGKAVGIYGRISAKAVIDYTAIDIAVLVETGAAVT